MVYEIPFILGFWLPKGVGPEKEFGITVQVLFFEFYVAYYPGLPRGFWGRIDKWFCSLSIALKGVYLKFRVGFPLGIIELWKYELKERKIMSKTRLTVRYINSQHDIDVDLDSQIEKTFNRLGFEWCGQGMDLVEPFERDIEFEKQGKK